MALKLWGRVNSLNVQKVRWCLIELALPHERVDVGLQFGGLDDAAYRRLNPNGLVPTLEDAGLVLWESNAIVRYLTSRYGADRLWVEDPAARAVGDKWMDWASTSFGPAMRDMFMNMVRRAPAERDNAAIEASRRRSEAAARLLDGALRDAGTPYLGGAAFGMGDIPAGALTWRWLNLPIDRPTLPHLQAWFDRLTARVPYQQAVMLPLS